MGNSIVTKRQELTTVASKQKTAEVPVVRAMQRRGQDRVAGFSQVGIRGVVSSGIEENPIYSSSTEILNSSKNIGSPLEDSQSAIHFDANDFEQLMDLRGYLANERWSSSAMIAAKITTITRDYVECDCLVDKDNRLFQTRSFPIMLFGHINHLHEGGFIWIKTGMKPGSTRIDILDAKKSIDGSIFEMNDRLEKLRNSGLDKPVSFDEDNL